MRGTGEHKCSFTADATQLAGNLYQPWKHSSSTYVYRTPSIITLLLQEASLTQVLTLL
jgi:hypothetical protein